jgi:hypothetical protein
MTVAVIHSLEPEVSIELRGTPPRNARSEESSAISNGRVRRNVANDLLCVAVFRQALPLRTATRNLVTGRPWAAQPSECLPGPTECGAWEQRLTESDTLMLLNQRANQTAVVRHSLAGVYSSSGRLRSTSFGFGGREKSQTGSPHARRRRRRNRAHFCWGCDRAAPACRRE